MIIAIMNRSGNVGKTTITREVFGRGLDGRTSVLEVEDTCTGNGGFAGAFDEYQNIAPDDFMALYGKIVETGDDEHLIIDIGASGISEVLRKFAEYGGVAEMIDKFVIPATKDAKQLRDTINTAISLKEDVGVPAEKIIFICNRSNKKTFEKDYAPLISSSEKYGFVCDKSLQIEETPLLKELEILKLTIEEMASDEEDYKQKIRETKGLPEQKRWIKADLAKRRAETIIGNFRSIAKIIGGEKELDKKGKEEKLEEVGL